MDQTFMPNELLLRAVLPPARRPDFWRNGHLTSAVLKDPKGLSVDRLYDRAVDDAVNFMHSHLCGPIVSFTVQDCDKVSAYVKYAPSFNNKYHTEVHGSETEVLLSDPQAHMLSKLAKLVADDYNINMQYI